MEGEVPEVYIRWKDTDVCMDFWCKCGHTCHIDAMFVYFIECGRCGTVYQLPENLELEEIIGVPKESELLTYQTK